MPSKPYIYRGPLKPRRCPPPSLTTASALLFRGPEGWPLFISGPTGGCRCLCCGTLLKRGPRVRSSLSRSSSFNGLPRPGVARELPFIRPFQECPVGLGELLLAGSIAHGIRNCPQEQRTGAAQPQKGACRLNSTAPVGPSWRHLAVGPIPPQLIGALDPPAVTSVSAVWGDLALRRFNDWRASAGARSSALPSCGAHSHQSTTPRARIDGKNRCTRRPTWPLRGGIWEQKCGL
jgi:hypothetical protein